MLWWEEFQLLIFSAKKSRNKSRISGPLKVNLQRQGREVRRKSSSRLGRGQSSADKHVIASTAGGGLLRQRKVFLNLTASGLREREREWPCLGSSSFWARLALCSSILAWVCFCTCGQVCEHSVQLLLSSGDSSSHAEYMVFASLKQVEWIQSWFQQSGSLFTDGCFVFIHPFCCRVFLSPLRCGVDEPRKE